MNVQEGVCLFHHCFAIGALLAISLLSPAAAAQVAGIRTANAATSLWDDATLLDPGSVSFDVYSYFDRGNNGYSMSGPGLDFTVGLNRRLELSAYSGLVLSKAEEDRSYGLDNTYLGLKVLLLPKGKHRPAIAVKPTLEILPTASLDPVLSPHRMNFALPVLIEKDFDSWSVSYTGGYISRGAAFDTVKLEGDWWKHLTPTLIISYSQFTTNLSTLSELGLNRRLIHTSVGLGKNINSRWSIFINVGRNLGRIDADSASFDGMVGVTFTGRMWGPAEGTKRKRFPIHL